MGFNNQNVNKFHKMYNKFNVTIKKLFVLIFFLFKGFFIYCQSISDIQATQIGESITIKYVLHRTEEVNLGTAIYLSLDRGNTFSGPLKTISGNFGKLVNNGLNTVFWDVSKERETLIGEVVFKVVAYPLTFTDKRDNRDYMAAFIDGQVWMGEDLLYAVEKGSWKVDWFVFYDWETAKGACPTNWHLPSLEEFKMLITTIGGEGKSAYQNMMNIQSNDDIDKYGYFTFSSPGTYQSGRQDRRFSSYWSSSPFNSSDAHAFIVYHLFGEVNTNTLNKNMGCSVRCLLNQEELISNLSNEIPIVIYTDYLNVQNINPVIYVKWFVYKNISEWQKRGEFEATNDYHKRVNEQTRKVKLVALAQEGLKQLKNKYTKTINWDQCNLSRYDADNQKFEISSIELGKIIFKVPLAEAPSFKDNWEKLQVVNIDFCPINDKLELSKISMKNPSNNKTYVFDKKLPVALDLDKISFSLPPID
jgi:uncharacterized protein (TIGR02145 family)